MKNYKQKEGVVTKDLRLDVPPVSKYMIPASKLVTFRKEDSIYRVIQTLLEGRITGAPVLNARQQLIGLIDDKDCLNLLMGSKYYNQPNHTATVENYMTDMYKTIPEDKSILDAANIFVNEVYKRLLVVDSTGKLIGQISRRDILSAIADMNSITW